MTSYHCKRISTVKNAKYNFSCLPYHIPKPLLVSQGSFVVKFALVMLKTNGP
jgi:hypothetical protein